jgi:hypothetical protein
MPLILEAFDQEKLGHWFYGLAAQTALVAKELQQARN